MPTRSKRSARRRDNRFKRLDPFIAAVRRHSSGRGSTYRDDSGVAVRDKATLARIRALVIPPAWTDVWIAPSPNGHLQATGRDTRKRKQYRYHPRWRQVRDETKYERLIPFASALPRIRQHVEEHLSLAGLPREKVLAMAVRLLETTFIRKGNEEYARNNGSYGLTTLRNRHVRVDGSHRATLSGQERQSARGCAHRPSPRTSRKAAARPAGTGALPVFARWRDAATDLRQRTSIGTCGRFPVKTIRPRIPDVGGNATGGAPYRSGQQCG